MKNDVRREKFVDAACDLYKERGIAATSVGDIADRVGVTRSLFYHYFANKSDITDAVIDRQVEGLMQSAYEWSKNMEVHTLRDALLGLAEIIRGFLQGPSSFSGHFMVDHDDEMYPYFVVRIAQHIANRFIQSKGRRGSLIGLTNTRHPRESAYVLCVGLMSMSMRQDLVDNEVIADLIVDTLHIELENTPIKEIYGQ